MFTRTRPQLESLETRDLLSGDWFSTYLPSASIANLARADWYNHGAITYNDMLGIYAQVERNGWVDAGEFASLQNLAATASALRMPEGVGFLASQVVSHNPANLSYQGYSLGYLAPGSSPSQLQLLVNKWFLGADHPLVAGGQGLTYRAFGGSLFGTGGPVYTD